MKEARRKQEAKRREEERKRQLQRELSRDKELKKWYLKGKREANKATKEKYMLVPLVDKKRDAVASMKKVLVEDPELLEFFREVSE